MGNVVRLAGTLASRELLGILLRVMLPDNAENTDKCKECPQESIRLGWHLRHVCLCVPMPIIAQDSLFSIPRMYRLPKRSSAANADSINEFWPSSYMPHAMMVPSGRASRYLCSGVRFVLFLMGARVHVCDRDGDVSARDKLVFVCVCSV